MRALQRLSMEQARSDAHEENDRPMKSSMMLAPPGMGGAVPSVMLHAFDTNEVHSDEPDKILPINRVKATKDSMSSDTIRPTSRPPLPQ